MFADSFSVLSVRYVDRGLRGCNIISVIFLYKCAHPSWNTEPTLIPE